MNVTELVISDTLSYKFTVEIYGAMIHLMHVSLKQHIEAINTQMLIYKLKK